MGEGGGGRGGCSQHTCGAYMCAGLGGGEGGISYLIFQIAVGGLQWGKWKGGDIYYKLILRITVSRRKHKDMLLLLFSKPNLSKILLE